MLSLPAALSCTLYFSSALHAQPRETGQFIAKQYTEVLGRIPDQSGWAAYVSYFNTYGCNWTNLWQVGRGFLTSAEFNNLQYDNASRVLVLYRSILNREPDPNGYSSALNLLNTGQETFSQLIDDFYNSAEFRGNDCGGLCQQICSTVAGGDPSYYWGPNYVITIPTTPTSGLPNGCYGGYAADLQLCINNTAGNVVTLAQKAVYFIGVPFYLSGKTLQTYGNPSHYKYAAQARIVRSALYFNWPPPRGLDGFPLIIMSGGTSSSPTTLQNIWLDGQRGYWGADTLGHSETVSIQGGYSKISNAVFSNTAGASTLHPLGTLEAVNCPSSIIDSNLLTAYSSTHFGGVHADGITVGCNNAVITNNQLVDCTDVPIVIFHAGAGNVQQATAHDNWILSAGNSAYGGMGFDTGNASDPNNQDTAPNFTGSSFYSNTIWSSAYSHFDIGLYVGVWPWGPTYTGTAASATSNTTGSQSMRVTAGIVVDGMASAYVQANTFTTYPASILSICNRLAGMVRDCAWNGFQCTSSHTANGNIQSWDLDFPYHSCNSH